MSNDQKEVIDIDNDGQIEDYEQAIYEKKARNRRKMAWISLIAMILTAFSLMFIVPESRLNQLNGLLELYWVALGSVVAAYVGISTWMTKK